MSGAHEKEIMLTIEKAELSKKISERIEIGKEILNREIKTKGEKQKAWDDFIDWNKFNEELLKHSFNVLSNPYYLEYKYKPRTGGIYTGIKKEKSFQEWVEVDKDHLKYQLRKLGWFLDKLELLKDTTNRISYPSNLNSLLKLLERFDRVVNVFQERPEFTIKNEFDVHYLLNGLLQIHFDDIRKEESSPSNAGSNSRLDFVLKREGIIIEVKLLSKNTSYKKIADELLIDILRYKSYPSCRDLVIFIYNNGGFIPNKYGFITDLVDHSTNELGVHVIISS
jgi:hypothetical protein